MSHLLLIEFFLSAVFSILLTELPNSNYSWRWLLLGLSKSWYEDWRQSLGWHRWVLIPFSKFPPRLNPPSSGAVGIIAFLLSWIFEGPYSPSDKLSMMSQGFLCKCSDLLDGKFFLPSPKNPCLTSIDKDTVSGRTSSAWRSLPLCTPLLFTWWRFANTLHQICIVCT